MTAARKNRILVVDDAPTALDILERNLSSRGYQVLTASNVADAVKMLEQSPVDLVITDYKMPKISGLDLVRHVRENYFDTEVIMITGYASVKGAVEAVKMGAEEYLPKPFTDEELFAAVERALNKRELKTMVKGRKPRVRPNSYGIIGESLAIRNMLAQIEKAAASSATVLVLGESGTGKELVARAIHYSSKRASAPFVPVNCGAIPEKLLESELFGYVKGAFTGATESRAGFFQTADGGTIFLDEINEMSPAMQVKLLRVLQDKQVCMVGARKTQKVDVRIVASSNKDLQSLVHKELFREDLFFRLNVVSITVPPLRNRQEDIPLLVSHFGAKFARELGKPEPVFPAETMEIFMNYAWPGNVRELENLVQRMVIMAEGETVTIPDLPSVMRFSALSGPVPFRSLAEEEAGYIRMVLASVGGNKSRAAEILGIDRKTLREKIKQAPLPGDKPSGK
ncbi:MAG TPA: sigma-54 dependent transcriptional regulator [Desulfomonilia bacterium]|jgi:two-component system response regulator HydG|nr:sigma-54 dependent transcriptional regulator [Deltaproteobacteria bacterium]HPD21430.1 sigma-54 dependent transcriptional regulator [Deltaproteobacteria bacterium]HPX51370.1 sigma-54 dependent transcriptional regulator [Deltaproteobacteria bacterium]HRS55079.1 sigma-54 dependent transcriptional regulator [Desulfomonilia bacterium]HRV34699.1 sigma-54 dependent transcriptional regulator [Desulfomonilia bacterium]